MISPWIEVLEVNGAHWVNLWTVLMAGSSSGRRRPGLLLFHEDGVVIRATVGDQQIPAGFPYPGREGLRVLARTHGAGRVFAIDVQAFPTLWAEVERQVRYGDDLVAFGLTALRTARAWKGHGLDIVPGLRLKWIPPRWLLELGWNALWPDGQVLAFYVIDGGAIYTSLILVKREGEVAVLTTDDGLEGEGLEAARWPEDLSRLGQVIARRWGPLYAGLFCERRTLEAVRSGTLSIDRAVAAGDLVFSPWPTRWRVLARVRKQVRKLDRAGVRPARR